ncbi:hypothetical protein ACJMK2_015753 [Sinanodonta woodiana]|uniref:SEFIR domain-containing protein n=1 Tax=Sinanodonta woodiana TaxID=1069815 RepID=A0ABD3URF3_SINWO
MYPMISDHSLQLLWRNTSYIKILTGTDVRIGMEVHPKACSALEKFAELRNILDKCSEPSVLNANIQVMNISKVVSITWVQQHTDNKCYSDEIFLLDVEQRMKDANTPSTFYISNMCFQFQIKSGSPKIKENVNYTFDCIELITETEAYLINTTLWSLPGKSLSSSDETNCGRNKCYHLKNQLQIGPTLNDNIQCVEECLCWDKSNITMEILAATEDGTSFRTFVTDINPYAKMLYFKVYKITDTEEHITFEKDILLIDNKVEQTTLIDFTLGCGTFITEIVYYCDADRIRCNSRCLGRHTSEFVVACKSVCRENRRKNLQAQSSESDVFPCNNQLDLIRMEMLSPVPYGNDAEEICFEEEPLAGTGQKVMLLCHQDCMDQHHKEILNLLVSLLRSLGMTIYSYDESALFANWLTLADEACNDSITDFIIVASSIDYASNESDGFLESSQQWLFMHAVMENLRICHANQKKFYVHILCFYESEAPIISNFIDKYKLCLKIRKLHKNTFIYCLSKYSEEAASDVSHMDALVCLLARILKWNLNDFEKRISYDANLILQNLTTVFETDFHNFESKI